MANTRQIENELRRPSFASPDVKNGVADFGCVVDSNVCKDVHYEPARVFENRETGRMIQ